MEWIVVENILSFLEMLTSCYLATGIFLNNMKGKKTALAIILFSIFGTILLTLREKVFVWVPDFAPSVFIFTLYAIMFCRAKWRFAVSWALVNYLFIGIISVAVDYSLKMCLGTPVEIEQTVWSIWFFSCLLVRIGQLLLSEIIICIWKRFQVSTVVYHGNWKIIIVSSVSIIMVWFLWGRRFDLNDDVLYANSLACLLILAINLSFLLFDEVLAREKYVEEELKTQNQIIALQMRSQDEVNSMYRSILSLKHDMNNHLHTIFGYIQVGEYAKAQEYVERISGEVSRIKSFHSGNTVVDALIGSKTALAAMNGIAVDVDMAVPVELKITDRDLTVMLGNLYDNAIDANMKFVDVNERFIHIRILFDSGNLIVMFENATIERDQSGDTGVWTTTKADSSMHGFGIKNIDRIVQTYGGYCEREIKNHVFRCRIRIPGK